MSYNEHFLLTHISSTGQVSDVEIMNYFMGEGERI